MTVELQPQFLRVSNYERYQHYKDRRPIWIKLYVDHLDDYQIKRQKPATRLLALLLLVVAAKQDNCIPCDAAWLAAETGLTSSAVSAAIGTLVEIGFLSIADPTHSASKLIADRSGSASPEKRREEKKREEKETPKGLRAVESIHNIVETSLREVS